MEDIIRKTMFFFITIWFNLKWSPRSPWCVARLNMAWNKYIATPMYSERVETFGEDWAEQHYQEKMETSLFVSLFTMREKLKVFFLPYSCGDKYKSPPIFENTE